MPNWVLLAEKAVAPIVTGASALVVSAVSFKRRLEDIEKDLRIYKEIQEKYLDGLKKAFRLELDDFKHSVNDRIEELWEEHRRHSQRFSNFRDSAVDFAREAELARFIEDQQSKWAQIQRTLGQIEGMLKKLP